MLNFYELLGISPYASRQQIEAALAQQQSLKGVPIATLQLAATTLLSDHNRQHYDMQLMTLDGDQQSTQPNSSEQQPTAPSYHPSEEAASFPAVNAVTHSDDGVIFYEGLHPHPQTHSHKASLSDSISDSFLGTDALTSVIASVLDVS